MVCAAPLSVCLATTDAAAPAVTLKDLYWVNPINCARPADAGAPCRFGNFSLNSLAYRLAV
jgi:hypothetical protein